MEYDNVLRDTNNKTQPSVFRFDSYPGPSNSQLWNQKLDDLPVPLQDRPPSHFNYTIQQIPSIPSSFSFTSGFSTATGALTNPLLRLNAGGVYEGSSILPRKRKSCFPPLQPCKQHITEEKMAEHMSKLHISSETATSGLEPDSVRNKRLYMCEEMRKLQTEPLLPTTLLAHMGQPCKALVLWQPPSKVLPVLSTPSFSDNPKSDTDRSDEDEDNSPVVPCDESDALKIGTEYVGTMDLDS